MNKFIYYISTFLFSMGSSIVIREASIDFKFIVSFIIMYVLTIYLRKVINKKFIINFYSIVVCVFIVIVSILIGKYKININKDILLSTIIIYILVLTSHKFMLDKINWWIKKDNQHYIFYKDKGALVFFKKWFSRLFYGLIACQERLASYIEGLFYKFNFL